MWNWEARDPRGVFVLVHGSGEHHGRYEWLIEKWRSNGFHVVMGDLPGHGAHPKIRGHIDSFNEYIDAVSRWVRKAGTLGLPIFLFGHSLGGLVVARTLMEKRLPITGVVLSSPCFGLVHPPPPPLQAFARVADLIAPKFRVRIKKPGGNPMATRNRDRLKEDGKDPLLVAKISIRWYNELERAIRSAWGNMDKFPDVPLLIMQAGSDRIVDKNRVYQWFNRLSIKDRTYKEWDGLFHEIFNEPEREEVFDYAQEFVNAHLPDERIKG